MSVFRPTGYKSYRADFVLFGQRHCLNTGLTTKREAQQWEAAEQRKLRERHAGIGQPDRVESPRIQEWAEVYIHHARKTQSRPERIEDLLRVALQFWGRRPGRDAMPDAPYHDLRLGDVVEDPFWIVKFDDWLGTRRTGRTKANPSGRPLAGQTKNQYRSVVSQLFDLAAQPTYRTRTQVTANPMRGAFRDRPVRRSATLTPDEIRRGMAECNLHVRLAMAIAVYAPKLRLGNILALRWNHEVSPDLSVIVVTEHKTARATARPLIVPISAPLRVLLLQVQQQARGPYVVTYRGRPLKTIRNGVRCGFERAGLTYGYQDAHGVTFHTLRHAMATLLARLHRVDGLGPLSEGDRMRAMGHTRVETTQGYTHVPLEDQVEAVERIAAAVPLADLFIDQGAADGRPRYRRTRRLAAAG